MMKRRLKYGYDIHGHGLDYEAAFGCECPIVDGQVDVSEGMKVDFTLNPPEQFIGFVNRIMKPWMVRVGPALKPYQNTSVYCGLCNALVAKRDSKNTLYAVGWIDQTPDWKTMESSKEYGFPNDEELERFIKFYFPEMSQAEGSRTFITGDFVMLVRGKRWLKVVPPVIPETRGMYQVYHLLHEGLLHALRSGGTIRFPEDYELVAQVFCDDLEAAKMLTRHCDKQWWKNPGVHLIKMTRKSTDALDVIRDPKGRFHLLTFSGFRVIEQRSIITREMIFARKQSREVVDE